MSVGEYWDDFYREGRGAWSGKPNRLLESEVSGLSPGTALDLGCGQGGDAIWLASHGWRVTGVDVSADALALAAEHAAAAGVEDAITWERHDLAISFPSGTFDLVSTHYLHSPVHIRRERILRSTIAAVAPGGPCRSSGTRGCPPGWTPTPRSSSRRHGDVA